ncbi:MAG: DUF2240 family protein [Promethearchaeota archaeon]
MKIETYINKIIEETGLSKNDIQKKVEKKKIELKGLISEEGALFIIAKEMGVDVKEENKDLLKEIEINVSDIRTNMKNITLIGRIKDIYNIARFNKDGGEIGQVGSFLLYDRTGDIRIVLWDEQVNIFKDNRFNTNELVKIINAYAKKGKYGAVELHIGKFSKIILSPEDVDYKKYPKMKKEFIPIESISLSMKSISIKGKIIQLSPLREFIKKNGDKGKVRSLNLIDPSGSIRITFWNDDTSKILDLSEGDYISITNLNPRVSNYNPNSIELYASKNSFLMKEQKEIEIKGNFIEKIKLLQSKKGIVSFSGIITSVDNLREVTLKSGRKTTLLSFVISDNSDGIRATLWGEQAEKFSEILKVGKGVLLKKVLIKYSNFSGRNEISFINESSIEIIKKEIENLKKLKVIKNRKNSDFTKNYTKIESINSSTVVEIKGFIVKELNNITIYEACSKCFKKIDNCICTEKGDIENRMIINIIIDDESGTIRATFIGDIAEKLIGEKTQIIYKLKNTPDFNKFLEKKSKELLGKDLILKGKIKFSDFSNSYELIVYDFQEVKINEELEILMKEIET